MELMIKAARLANHFHRNQHRKWPDQSGVLRPYITHPARVASMVILNSDLFVHTTLSVEEATAAAWLHDVLEDCSGMCDYVVMTALMGRNVAGVVKELTNEYPFGQYLTREQKKRIDRERLSGVSRAAKVIKHLDRLDNLQELSNAPDDFVRLYCQETEELLKAIYISSPDVSMLRTKINLEIERISRKIDLTPNKACDRVPVSSPQNAPSEDEQCSR